MNHKILVLAGKGASTDYLLNWLDKNKYSWQAVLEDGVSKKKFLRYRIKKLGLITVLGQLVFLLAMKPIICFFSKKRTQEIIHQVGFSDDYSKENLLMEVTSINNEKVINCINDYKPTVILVNGTRIISKRILGSTQTKFINIHAGITPAYRGTHGAYWAYWSNKPHLAGVTLHYVDAGVDTGGVIGQKLIDVTPKDNYCTYPFLQLNEGLFLLKQYLKDDTGEILNEYRRNIPEESHQWYHPTFLQYLTGLIRGVK